MKRFTSLLCLVALAAPAAALAQSAGDEQYADPFAGQGQSQGNSGSGNSGSGNSGSGGNDTPRGTSQSGSGQSSGQSGTSQAQAGDGSTGSTSGNTLAYTGVEIALIALLGAITLAGGLMLWVLARPPAAFARSTPPLLGRDVLLRPRAKQR